MSISEFSKMSSSAPLDLDKPIHSCTILVDLENVRLAWQQYYRHVFSYEDLVYLVLNAERHAKTRASKVMFFMTEPNEGLFRSKEQQFRQELKRMKPKSPEAAIREHMIKCLYEEHRQYTRLVKKLIREGKKTENLSGDLEPLGTEVGSDEWNGGLGGDGTNGRRCKVEARTYGVKRWKGQSVQRGCDVAVASELTKACFNPKVDRIILFSGDSDFDNIVRSSLESEDVGGGVEKLAKDVWVMSFSASLMHSTLKDVRRLRLRQGIRFVLLDEDFPEIGQNFLDTKVKRFPIPDKFYQSDDKSRHIPGREIMFAQADKEVRELSRDSRRPRPEEGLSDISDDEPPRKKRKSSKRHPAATRALVVVSSDEEQEIIDLSEH